MTSIKELNPHGFKTNPSIDNNLLILCQRLMELQDACEINFVITSGLRDESLQVTLIQAGKTKAITSKHLAGAAADIADPDGLLAKWCISNLQALKNIGLWMEDPGHTIGWVHLQMMAPKSGNRVFIP